VVDNEVVGGPARKVTLRVERQWKGASSPSIVLYTAAHATMCGASLLKDQTYLVVARRDSDRLNTDLCVQKFIDEHVVRFVLALEEGEAVPPSPAR
jgi:hypothetical protein